MSDLDVSRRREAPRRRWPETPDRDSCVFRHQLEKHARERPDSAFVRFEDGPTWSFAEALEIARRSASGLAALGVKFGEPVFIWTPTSPEYIEMMFGAHYLGAVVASPNTAYRGGVLEHLIKMTDARVAVVHANLLDRLGDIDLGRMRTIVVCGDMPSGPGPEARLVPVTAVTGGEINESVLEIIVEPWDVQYIIYTSGTTGPSKGVIVTYAQMLANAQSVFEGWYGPGDGWLVQLPMFHLSGTIPYSAALAYGARVIMAQPFSVSTFWAKVRALKPTFAVILGSMATLLQEQPPANDDAGNSLRRVIVVPFGPAAVAFGKRFGVDVKTYYGSSEAPVPIQSDWNPEDHDSCGHLVEGFESRIVDDFDREQPVGEAGELILRNSRPWIISTGYWRNAEATASLWRNGWFHTGDTVRRNADGEYYFLGRKKDAIRRRGENISSFEVERDVLAHPEVEDAAAIGVANPLGEEDVFVAVVLKPTSSLTPLDLFEFLRPRMAHFMLPRYLRIVEALPMTATGRPQKFILREQGVTPDTWDREQAGIKITRENI